MPVKEVEKFMIIGLGIFGSELAIDLSRKGHQVIGVDSDRDRANRLKDIACQVNQTMLVLSLWKFLLYQI